MFPIIKLIPSVLKRKHSGKERTKAAKLFNPEHQ